MAAVRRASRNARRVKGITLLAGLALLLGIGEGSRQYYRFQQQRTTGMAVLYANPGTANCLTGTVQYDPKLEHNHDYNDACRKGCTAPACEKEHHVIAFDVNDPDGIARLAFYDTQRELGEIVLDEPIVHFNNNVGLHGFATTVAVYDDKGRVEYFIPQKGGVQSQFWVCDAPHNAHAR